MNWALRFSFSLLSFLILSALLSLLRRSWSHLVSSFTPSFSSALHLYLLPPTLGLGLVYFETPYVLADLTAGALYLWCLPSYGGLSELSLCPCSCPGRNRWIHPIESLIPPPSRETLGVLLMCGFCSLLGALLRVLCMGLLAQYTHASLSWSSAVSPASPFFLGCHSDFPGSHWVSRVSGFITLSCWWVGSCGQPLLTPAPNPTRGSLCWLPQSSHCLLSLSPP